VPYTGKRKHPGSDMQEIDTSGILFMCGGAFVGLDKIVQRRIENRSIGFSSKLPDPNKNSEFYQKVTPKDIIQFGFIPEFVGRFSIITNVDELTEEQLVKILIENKNSLVKQYTYMFELDGIDIHFENSALAEIARRAKELKTNARGLKNILEKTLLPYQFDAVNLLERGLRKIVISKDTIGGNPAVMIFDKKAQNEK
jgi:ATP-dependent Clp protease ATP-binding subunit ClpX